ncbi:hypothetical protein V5799_027157 [Amblyomma americanum]|uniref:Uncharacterized protein n=1 Tax=Amblyomma americanum TaxID=6943 RepID=A0AAQ4DGI7_AMBAM
MHAISKESNSETVLQLHHVVPTASSEEGWTWIKTVLKERPTSVYGNYQRRPGNKFIIRMITLELWDFEFCTRDY